MFDENLHNLIKKRNKTAAFLIFAIIIIFGVGRIIITHFYVEPEIHFYKEDGMSIALISDYAAGAVVVALYILSAFFYKYKRDEHNYAAYSDCFIQGTFTETFTASLAGFVLVFSSGLQAFGVYINGKSRPFGDVIINYMKENKFDFIIFFISLLCAVYFFKTAALGYNGENEDDAEYSQWHIFLSFTPILWSFLNVFKCFFDMSRSVNSPVRIYELMCFLALSAYFVSESRMLVGRREIARYFTYAYITLFLVALSALPTLILSAFWTPLIVPNNPIILYAVELAFALYIVARIYSQIRHGKFLLER